MKSLSFVLLMILFAATLAIAGNIRDGSLSAYSNGSSIVVRWVSDDEGGVTGYEIERRAGSGPFILLTPAPIQTKGNGASYDYTDNSAFRVTDNIYQYRVRVLGPGVDYFISVRHNVSGVRRTWGSIKAMFR